MGALVTGFPIQAEHCDLVRRYNELLAEHNRMLEEFNETRNAQMAMQKKALKDLERVENCGNT